jgi:hypothetical protein
MTSLGKLLAFFSFQTSYRTCSVDVEYIVITNNPARCLPLSSFKTPLILVYLNVVFLMILLTCCKYDKIYI